MTTAEDGLDGSNGFGLRELDLWCVGRGGKRQALALPFAMAQGELVEEALTGSVIGAFYEVYNTLGFGFLEHVYVLALERELLARGHNVAREVSVRVHYKGELVGLHRLDMLVDDRLIVETKSTLALHSSAARQLFNYLRATDLKVGLLLHFGPKPFFHRQINHRA